MITSLVIPGMTNKSFEGLQILDNEGPTVPNGFKINSLNGSSIQIELNQAQWKRISNRRFVTLENFFGWAPFS